jgi:DNA modification methylase
LGAAALAWLRPVCPEKNGAETEIIMNQNRFAQTGSQPRFDTVVQGDCIEVMRQMPSASVDLIVTDPPYLQNYHSRDGRGLQNDTNDRWLKPAFAQAFRVLKPNRFCVCFYSWPKADRFLEAWRSGGFHTVGHLVFRKTYTSKARFLQYRHEQAYLLAKGNPPLPEHPIPDVLEMRYTGNKLHPTQKPASALMPLVQAFSRPGELVLDPFCGSGSSLIAAQRLGRHYLGIELDAAYFAITRERMQKWAAA